MQNCQTEQPKPVIMLDTNVFYDFCHVLGFDDFGFKCGVNKRVDYDKFKSYLENQLQNQKLFIPSTTLFEFVCRYRNEPDKLERILIHLKGLSQRYDYNLFQYHNYGILFMLDEYNDAFWKVVQFDYSEIIKWQEMIMLAKIGAEAEILTVFSKIIAQLYLFDYYKKNTKFETIFRVFSAKTFFNFFDDVAFKHCKREIAHKMHDYYKNGREHEIKKDIVDIAIKTSTFFIEIFFKGFDGGELYEKSICETNDSLQHKIHKWYNKEKDKKLLDEQLIGFEKLLKTSGFNNCQISYFKKAMYDLFMQGTKREKNDAEDFWNLGFVRGDTENLITFELEMIDAIRETNIRNYQTIADFYEC